MTDLPAEHDAFLQDALGSLSPRQRTLFALGCAEHVRYYLEDEESLAEAVRAALDVMWGTVSGLSVEPEQFDGARVAISELCDNDDEEIETDLLQPLFAVDYAFDTVTEPAEIQGARYASSSGIATAHYADMEDEDGKDLEVLWQRELLRRVSAHGDLPASRDVFADLFDVVPPWMAFTPRG